MVDAEDVMVMDVSGELMPISNQSPAQHDMGSVTMMPVLTDDHVVALLFVTTSLFSTPFLKSWNLTAVPGSMVYAYTTAVILR